MFVAPKPLDNIILYCLPFAGGDSRSYRNLQQHLAPHILLKSPELRGRNSRINEAPLTNIHPIAADIFQQLQLTVGSRRYALYGHSMGALLVYLVTQFILKQDFPPPTHLWVSGLPAPSIPRPLPHKYRLTKSEFINYIKDLGGLPEELLAYPDIVDFFEPILRADVQAVETYHYQVKPPFDLPLTIFDGEQDKNTTEAGLLAWQQETTQPITRYEYQGGHFFINKHLAEIGRLISNTLNND